MTRYLKPDNPDECISCNICLTACPVAKATRKYRGPKMTGPALSRIRMLIEDEDPMLQYCSNCKNCDRVCPSGTTISTFNMKARSLYYKNHSHSFAEKLLSNNEKVGRILTKIPFAPIISNLSLKVAKSTGALKLAGLSCKAPYPSYANKSFYDLFDKYKQPIFKKKVLFYPGCYVNYNEPQVGIDLIKVYNKNNIQVIVDKRFVCCGSPMISAGYLEKVEQNALHNIKILLDYALQGIDIITTCTTCGLILKQEYLELFKIDSIKEYNVHMYDSIEYLKNLHEKGELDTSFKAVDSSYIYHTPCHLKVQGFGRPSLDILKLVPNLSVEDADASCCGLSGIYGYKSNTEEIAREVGSELKNKIIESKAKMGVCECNICRLQMQNGTGKSAEHPLSVLAKAYGLK